MVIQGWSGFGQPVRSQIFANYSVRMDAEELKSACLGFPGAVEEFPFDGEVSVFKVAGKMFALSRLAELPLQVNTKCDPETALLLRATYPAITAGYHMNKKHWNTITVDGSITDQMLLGLIEDSYDLVVQSLPRAQREALKPVQP